MLHLCILIISTVIINIIITCILYLNTDNESVKTVPSFLSPSEELQKVYLDGLTYCGEQNFVGRGPYISCMNTYIEKNASQESKAYKRIKLYCRIKEDNECNIDNCINEVVLGF